jgi:hypothetical protein
MIASENASALIALADAVRAQFVGTDVVVGVVGRRERSKLINQSPVGANRVLFIQPPDGARGTLKRGQQAHTEPRVLLEWTRPIILSVWSADALAPDDEEAQIEASETLLESTFQCIRRAVSPEGLPFFGNLTFGAIKEMGTPKNAELYYGIELQVSMTLRGPLFDRQKDKTRPAPSLTRATLS